MAEEKKVVTIHLPSINVWMVTTVILLIALVAFYFIGFPSTGMFAGGLTADQASKKAIDYINNNLVQSGSITLVSVKEANGMFMVTTIYQGQEIPVYVTKDGSLLFISQPIDMSGTATTTTTQPTVTPKTDKPTVELFVMGFCPYGVQAENLMKPVFDLLGTKADIKIRFIATVGGTTVDSIQSLHGTTEAQEDLRQLYIMNNYNQTVYWKYLMYMDNNCYGKITTTDAAALDTCWKTAATGAGIDVAKVSANYNSIDTINLLKADEQLTTQYGVTGSPTLIINGVTYSGTRTSDAFKQAICDAFTTAPAGCNQTLSSSSGTAAATGGC